MDTTVVVIILAIVAMAAIVVAAFYYFKYRQRETLRKRFGPEYARAVKETGNVRDAEGRLKERERRVASLSVRTLSQDDISRYRAAWQKIQSEFVDDPKSAVLRADGLLQDVMNAKGYPASDFEQRSADLSVNHPVAVQNLRTGHEIIARQASGSVRTEELRQAMVQYQTVLDELVNDNENTPVHKAS